MPAQLVRVNSELFGFQYQIITYVYGPFPLIHDWSFNLKTPWGTV